MAALLEELQQSLGSAYTIDRELGGGITISGTRIISLQRRTTDCEKIFSMRPDGANVSQLTSGYRDRQPTWAPDGMSIAFGSVSASKMCVDDDDGDGSFSHPCGHDIVRVSLDGVLDPLSALSSASNAAWHR